MGLLWITLNELIYKEREGEREHRFCTQYAACHENFCFWNFQLQTNLNCFINLLKIVDRIECIKTLSHKTENYVRLRGIRDYKNGLQVGSTPS